MVAVGTDRLATRISVAAGLMDGHFLPKSTRDRLRQIALQPWSQDFYLAGSTALAVHIEHRRPHGLDLMSRHSRLVSPERRDLMGHLSEARLEVEVETARDGYLDLRCSDGIPVRLYHYPYPLVEPTVLVDGLAMVSIVDLALMKLGAVISRGARRDFVDLFLLCRSRPLDSILARSQEKFPKVRDFPLQALKGLADYRGVSGEPMPKLEVPLSWSDIEVWLEGDVRRVARKRLGL